LAVVTLACPEADILQDKCTVLH